MWSPKVTTDRPPLRLSGLINIDVHLEVTNDSFPDDHKYPDYIPGTGPGLPANQTPERRGNLVDENAIFLYKVVGTIGVDVDILSVHVSQLYHITPATSRRIDFKCSEGIPIPVESDLNNENEE